MLRRPAGKLSGGERKMLVMGRALMRTPAELTASQDFVRSFLGGRVAQG
jgi:ABC-type molybdate transport system ATPase subunit